jgi:hypothetical protein
MRTIRHPLSGATYDLLEDGTVRVEARDGAVGIFDPRGNWISGEHKHADPHLCLWIGGRDLSNRFQMAAEAMKSDATAPAEELTQ